MHCINVYVHVMVLFQHNIYENASQVLTDPVGADQSDSVTLPLPPLHTHTQAHISKEKGVHFACLQTIKIEVQVLIDMNNVVTND